MSKIVGKGFLLLQICMTEYMREIEYLIIFLVNLQFKMDYSNAYKKQGLIFKTMPPYNEMPNRSIITNVPDYQVVNNSIKTSKYNFIDFVPLNLIVQFSKLPNIYFLIIGIMQMIPQISISGGFPVIFIPLSIVVSVSALKDLFEDLKRKKSDNQINLTQVEVLKGDTFEKEDWSSLKIGQIIRVNKNEQFPADIILLQSSEQKLNCYIQTKNLDGETNLKYKQAKYEIAKDLRSMKGQKLENLSKIRYEFKYERPNPFIYSFTGSCDNVPLDNNNIVLRGCSLRITSWVTGLIIYTGVDSKIMLNSNKARQKKSRLQFKMGLIVIAIFFTQMLLTFFNALVSIFTTPTHSDYYILSFWTNLFIKWGSWILLFTNFVPISLIVTLDMVKYIQGINISNSSFLTTQPSEVRVQTSALNEELGQIEHVFSDKTGTLTKNYMSFKYMIVGEQTFGYDSVRTVVPKNITNVDFHDQQFLRKIKGSALNEKSNIVDMILAFALCHNVIIEEDENKNKKYNASSPDELAFINMANHCGFQYLGINQNNELCIKISQKVIEYKLLHIIEFDSDRKRMSVILQKDDKIIVYCKGADNIMLKRLKSNSKAWAKVNDRLSEWSQEGLRTLVFAKRQITKKDYEKWAKMYASSLSKLQKVQQIEIKKQKKEFQRKISLKANDGVSKGFNLQSFSKLIIQDSSISPELLSESPEMIIHKILNDNSLLSQNQKQFIDKYFDKMSEDNTSTSKEIEQILQQEFELIGATAIEDQLQDNVKKTIENLRMADIKVWMLTGDKKETAINIGISCGLISPDMATIYWQNTVQQTLAERQKYSFNRQCCLIATGDDLLKEIDEKVLLKLVNKCKAVICCRVTPKQKQDMVWLMRKNKCTTLAIGDGANDVNMINTAHVGVGIKGVEGAQAALCSDYAISEFQILGQLMLYHGRQCYRKNSQLILFNFYKNLLLVMPQLWFGFNNHFSSATIYDPWIYQIYNVVFTSFPIAIYAVFDKAYTVKKSLEEPKLYQLGLKNQLFNLKYILYWFLTPSFYAFFLANLNFLVLQQTIDGTGYMLDLLSSGMTIFAQCVIIVNLKVLVMANVHSCGLMGSVGFGIVAFYLSSFIQQKVFPISDTKNIILMQIVSIRYWGSICACVGLIMIFELAVNKYYKLLEKEDSFKVEFQEIEMPLMTKQQL